MSELLYIHANVKPKGESRTLRISDSFIDAYKKSHPNDEVIELDLYKEDIGFIDAEFVALHSGGAEQCKENPKFKYACQFLGCDKIVIAAPFWNLSFPAIIKAYFDYVMVSGITFKYTSQGPVGLCQGKKAIHIVTRGGEYSEGYTANFELGDKYIKTILGFLGFSEVSTIAVENMDRSSTNVEAALQEAILNARKKAEEF